MAKCKDGTFYATVLIDEQGAETVLYNGASVKGMQDAYDRIVKSQQAYAAQGKPYTVWSFDQGKEVLAASIERRQYLPGQFSSIDRQGKGLAGEYETLEKQQFIASQEVPPYKFGDIVTPHPLYLPDARWHHATVIGVHYYSQVDGNWVVDVQRMEDDGNGGLAYTSVKEYMLAAWEVQARELSNVSVNSQTA